jgi:hypothetical protein
MKKKYDKTAFFLSSFYFLICWPCLLSHNKQRISGKATDQSDTRMTGANVIVKGATKGTPAGNNGAHGLTVTLTGKQRLIVSKVGYGSNLFE